MLCSFLGRGQLLLTHKAGSSDCLPFFKMNQICTLPSLHPLFMSVHSYAHSWASFLFFFVQWFSRTHLFTKWLSYILASLDSPAQKCSIKIGLFHDRGRNWCVRSWDGLYRCDRKVCCLPAGSVFPPKAPLGPSIWNRRVWKKLHS